MKELENIEQEENINRKSLKPFFGIPAIIYVNFLWLLVAVFILIWILGIILKPQSSLIVESDPSGAVVFWNGKIIGNTPLKLKLQDSLIGEGTLSIHRKGFFEKEENLKLYSWPFPFSFLGDRKVFISLEPSLSQEEIINLEIKDLDYWLTLGEPTYRFPSPPLFSQWKSDFKNQKEIFLGLLKEGFPLINSNFYWNDFQKTYTSYFNLPNKSPWDLWLHLQENLNLPPQALGFYYSILPEEDQNLLLSNANFLESYNSLSFSLSYEDSNLPTLPLGLLQFINFQIIPSSLFEKTIILSEVNQNLSFNVEIELPSFYMTRMPINKGQVELFLKSYAKWRPEYREGLMQEGLSDESYLKSFFWDELSYSDPAVFIPYYFAEDFALWINNTYLKGTNLKASLPSTLQWEVAMKEAYEVNQQSNVSHWFWMRDSYTPSSEWFRTQENPLGVNQKLSLLQGEIRSLNNLRLNISSKTKASLPKNWTGPNLSFYLIIQEENNL